MLDIKLIRENPEKIDVQRRKVQSQADELRAKRKKDSQMIGELKKKGENTDAVQAEVKLLGDEIKALEEEESKLDEKQRDLLLHTPNTPDETTLSFQPGANLQNLILTQKLTGIYAKKKISLILNAA